MYKQLSLNGGSVPKTMFTIKKGTFECIITECVRPGNLVGHLAKTQSRHTENSIDQLIHFLKNCQSISCQNYGLINEFKKGEYSDWPGFLSAYLNTLLLRIKKIEFSHQNHLLQYYHSLHAVLTSNAELFKAASSCLIVKDLNIHTFFLDESDVLWLMGKEFIAGDLYFMLGKLMFQTYGTSLCRDLFLRWKEMNASNFFKVYFYAFLLSLEEYLSQMEAVDELSYLAETSLRYVPFLDLCQHILKQGEQIVTFIDLFQLDLLAEEDFGIKQNPFLSERTLASQLTLNKILPIIRKAGITRFPEITELDKTGILAFQSIRPDAEIDEETFTVFSGRGATKEDCMVSALAEGIERFCAEKKNFSNSKILIGSYADLKKNYFLIHPSEFNAPKAINFQSDEILEWVPSVNLIDGKRYYVTANTVFYPYFPSVGRSLFRYFTTGLAAGNSYLEAISHGLFEVIERDASAINLLKSAKNPAVNLESITCIEAKKIIDQLKQANLNVIVRNITTPDIKIPVFSVICEELDFFDSLYVSGGYGSHLNKDIALVNALNEAALSRVSTISGAREDIKKFEKKREIQYTDYKEQYKNWFNTSNSMNYQAIESLSFPTVLDDVKAVCHHFLKAGFNKLLVVDLSVQELVLPVVKVLVPGVERYSFKMTCVGDRGKKAKKGSSDP